MSAGWEVGDLAVCTSTAPKGSHNIGAMAGHAKPKKNGIYKVERVIFYLNDCGLVLEGHHSTHFTEAWAASGFRKIKPDTEGANEDDAAWLKDLLSKPKVRS